MARARTDFTNFKQITITTTDAMATGYTVKLEFDHAALVTASKSQADGDDLAVFYDSTANFTGSEVELDRILWDQDGTTSAWNSATTQIAFKAQAAINASSADSTHYRIYYGNTDNTPPANKSNVYLFFDGFDSDTSANYTKSGATMSVSGGVATVTTGGTGVCGATYTTSLGAGSFCYEVKYKNTRANSGSNYQYFVYWGTSTTTALDASLRFQFVNDFFQHRSNAYNYACSNTPISHSAHSTFELNDAFHTFRITRDAPDDIENSYVDGTQHHSGVSSNWSTEPTYFGVGTNGIAEALYIDDFKVRLFTTEEPTLTLGLENNNNVPNAPTNSTPANSATNQSVNPTLTSSAFSDPDASDTHTTSQWLVATDSGFTDTVWDSGEETSNLTSIVVNSTNGTFGGSLSGKTKLGYNTAYYWKVKHEDNNNAWSNYSSATSFTTRLATIIWNKRWVNEVFADYPVKVSKVSQVRSYEGVPTDTVDDGTLSVDVDNNDLYFRSNSAHKKVLTSGATTTTEEIQDAVGAMIADTSSVNLTYTDATPELKADVLPAGVDHSSLASLNTTNYTHLTAANHTDLTDGGATTLHKHDHGGQDGLTDDDHTQYVLRQPAADIVINESGGDFDLRIEGDTDVNTFYLNAGTNSVGIGLAAPTSKFHVEGSQAVAYLAITADRTLDISDYMVDVTANSVTVNLPTAVGIEGRVYVIKNSGTGTVTIDGNSTQTIDGLELYVISTQYNSVTIVSDNANWKVI